MRIKMLSTQQESAHGTTLISGEEYDVTQAEGDAFISKGQAAAATSATGAPAYDYNPNNPNTPGTPSSTFPLSRPDLSAKSREDYTDKAAAADRYTGQRDPRTGDTRPDVVRQQDGLRNQPDYHRGPAVGPEVPQVEGGVPHPLRSKADLSKPLNTRDGQRLNAEEAAVAGYPVRNYTGISDGNAADYPDQRYGTNKPAGYPNRGYEDSPTGYPAGPGYVNAPVMFPPKAVLCLIPKPPTGVGPTHVGGFYLGIQKKQTVIVKHHDSVIDILRFLSEPTDGSVEILRPDTNVPFALEDFPYAYLFHNEVLRLRNYSLSAYQTDSTGPYSPSGKLPINEPNFPLSRVRGFDTTIPQPTQPVMFNSPVAEVPGPLQVGTPGYPGYTGPVAGQSNAEKYEREQKGYVAPVTR